MIGTLGYIINKNLIGFEIYVASTSRNTAYKKSLEYLFWISDPEMAGGSNEHTKIPEEGFLDREVYMVGILKFVCDLKRALYTPIRTFINELIFAKNIWVKPFSLLREMLTGKLLSLQFMVSPFSIEILFISSFHSTPLRWQ